MNANEARAVFEDALRSVAPEADLTVVDAGDDLREQIDLDSMDFLNIVVALHERTGIDIPERDYPKMASLDGVISYLVDHSSGPLASV